MPLDLPIWNLAALIRKQPGIEGQSYALQRNVDWTLYSTALLFWSQKVQEQHRDYHAHSLRFVRNCWFRNAFRDDDRTFKGIKASASTIRNLTEMESGKPIAGMAPYTPRISSPSCTSIIGNNNINERQNSGSSSSKREFLFSKLASRNWTDAQHSLQRMCVTISRRRMLLFLSSRIPLSNCLVGYH